MNPGLLNDSQKTEARTMMLAIYKQIDTAKQTGKRGPVILDDELMTLRSCGKDGARTVAELNIIRAVHGRIKGIKTPEQVTGDIAELVRKGRKANGLE